MFEYFTPPQCKAIRQFVSVSSGQASSSKFVKISQSSSKFVTVRQNFVKIRQDFVKIRQKIRHGIGFYSDEEQILQKKRRFFLQKIEFRVVQRNTQRVDFEKC